MLIPINVRLALRMKNHRGVATELTSKRGAWFELDAKKRRKLPCSICGK